MPDAVTPRPSRFIFVALFLMAGSAILYELLLASLLSYLLGATVLYFSLTIGVFLFALGVGAWISQYLVAHLLRKFLTLEALLGILGGCAVPFVLIAYAFLFERLGVLFERSPVEAFLRSGGFELTFQGLSFLYLFGIGLLVGVELPLFTRLAGEFTVLREALARVFFWDYLGSLAASVLFPLLLLPALGFLRTGFLVGIINLAAAAMLARAMRQKPFFRNFSRLGGALLGLGAVTLALGFALAPRLEDFFIREIFAGNRIIVSQTSSYQGIIVSENPKRQVSLFLNWELQFRSGTAERLYHETFAHPVMAFLGDRARRILVLGGGDGLLLRELWKYSGVERVTLVDIDPAVTSLAAGHPVLASLNERSLDDPRLTLMNADAFAWLLNRSARGEPFDAIFIDFPDPTDDALKRLFSREFYFLVKRNLRDDGIAVVQANVLPSKPHEVIRKTLRDAGFHILTLHSPPTEAIPEPEGMFDSAFVAASPSLAVLEELYRALGSHSVPLPDGLVTLSRENVARVLDPYLDAGEAASAAPNSLFHPAHFGFKRGLFNRFLEIRLPPGVS